MRYLLIHLEAMHSMKKKIRHPFRPNEQVEGAVVTQGDPTLLNAALAEHVVGHRITKVEFVRSLDTETSAHMGIPIDNIDLVICLDNNVAYIARLVVPSLAVVSRGEALSHIREDDENYVRPRTDN